MANVNLVKGLNFDDGTQKLVNVFGGSVGIFNSGTSNWDWQVADITGSDVEMEYCQNYGYLYNGFSGAPWSLSSAGAWSQSTNLGKSPWGYYPLAFRQRLMVGKCYIPTISQYLRRHVFYTDIIERDSGVVWGLTYGTNLSQTASNKKVTSTGANFLSNGIKIGDPFIIFNGTNAGVYAVREVIDENNLEVDRNLANTTTNSTFLVGGNYVVLENDVTGVGQHYGAALFFEYNKAWRWAPSIGLKEIVGVKGTNSHRSIVRHRGFTFWFHPSEGIISFNGDTAKTISDKISDIIQNISSSTTVIGMPGKGRYKNHVYFYVGNVTITKTFPENDIVLTNCVLDYNIARETWKVHEYPFAITCATDFIESGIESTYIGTDKNLVLKFNDTTVKTDYDVDTNNGTATFPIEVYGESHPVYPSGPEVINQFDSVHGFTDEGTNIKFQYMRCGTPNGKDSDWSDTLEINQRYDQHDLDFQARGVSWRFSEISSEDFRLIGLSFIWRLITEAYEDD